MRAVQTSVVVEATAEVAAAAAVAAGPVVAAAVPEVRREGGTNASVRPARHRAGPTRAAATRIGSVRPSRCEAAAVESVLASSLRPSVPRAPWAWRAGPDACSAVLDRIGCENWRPSAQRSGCAAHPPCTPSRAWPRPNRRRSVFVPAARSTWRGRPSTTRPLRWWSRPAARGGRPPCCGLRPSRASQPCWVVAAVHGARVATHVGGKRRKERQGQNAEVFKSPPLARYTGCCRIDDVKES